VCGGDEDGPKIVVGAWNDLRAAILVTLVITSALSLDAQIAVTLIRGPDGREEIIVDNNSTLGLMAFVVYAKELHPGEPVSTPLLVYSDAIDPGTKPLPPSEQRVAVVKWSTSPGGHVFEKPVIATGIFADGTTTGNTALIARLISRRSNMLLAVQTGLDILADALPSTVSEDQLIQRFGKMADSLNRWYLPPEQQAARAVYLSMLAELMDLPRQLAGSALPASFVVQETEKLRQRRVTLLESQPALAGVSLVR
jgi:hypothetical protein